LRDQYPAVLPGYHMNKKHWNTILLDGSIPSKLLQNWIDESYIRVVNALPKRERASFFTL
jgi:predicted DNA-binding protein (MmcQ/YjbR family)